nr:uncharacterized protein LOC128684737 [Cherax quadricarinatus]
MVALRTVVLPVVVLVVLLAVCTGTKDTENGCREAGGHCVLAKNCNVTSSQHNCGKQNQVCCLIRTKDNKTRRQKASKRTDVKIKRLQRKKKKQDNKMKILKKPQKIQTKVKKTSPVSADPTLRKITTCKASGGKCVSEKSKCQTVRAEECSEGEICCEDSGKSKKLVGRRRMIKKRKKTKKIGCEELGGRCISEKSKCQRVKAEECSKGEICCEDLVSETQGAVGRTEKNACSEHGGICRSKSYKCTRVKAKGCSKGEKCCEY